MDITVELLKTYLRALTTGWSVRESGPPDSPFEYAYHVNRLKPRVEGAGEMEPLRLGIEYLLAHPEIDYGPIISTTTPYTNESARELLVFMHEHLWPQIPIPEEGPKG